MANMVAAIFLLDFGWMTIEHRWKQTGPLVTVASTQTGFFYLSRICCRFPTFFVIRNINKYKSEYCFFFSNTVSPTPHVRSLSGTKSSSSAYAFTSLTSKVLGYTGRARAAGRRKGRVGECGEPRCYLKASVISRNSNNAKEPLLLKCGVSHLGPCTTHIFTYTPCSHSRLFKCQKSVRGASLSQCILYKISVFSNMYSNLIHNGRQKQNFYFNGWMRAFSRVFFFNFKTY